MAPVKVQNEMLLDLARNLRQERLLIGSERQNLQTLNLKVNVICDIFLSVQGSTVTGNLL
jgi:hypothetical protein